MKTAKSKIMLTTIFTVATLGCKTTGNDSATKDLRFISTDGKVEVISLKDGIVTDKMCSTELDPNNRCNCAVSRGADSMTIKEYLSHISYGDTGLWPQTEQGNQDLIESANAAQAAADKAPNDKDKAAIAATQKKYVDNMKNVLQLRKSLSESCINVHSSDDNYEFLRAPFVAKQQAKADAEARDRATMKQCQITVYTTRDRSPAQVSAGLDALSPRFNHSENPIVLNVTENQVSCFTPALGTWVGLFVVATRPDCRLYPEVGMGNMPTNTQRSAGTHVMSNNTSLFYFETVQNGTVSSDPTIIQNTAPYCYMLKRIPTAEFQ